MFNVKYQCMYMYTGSESTACSSGDYSLTRIPETNAYLLVIDDWVDRLSDTNLGIGCLVERTWVTKEMCICVRHTDMVVLCYIHACIKQYYCAEIPLTCLLDGA